MVVEYALVLVTGLVFGALGMRFFNRGMRQMREQQLALKRGRQELSKACYELTQASAQNLALLNSMAEQYRRFHQETTIATNRLVGGSQASGLALGPAFPDRDEEPQVHTMPTDYSATPSGLLRGNGPSEPS